MSACLRLKGSLESVLVFAGWCVLGTTCRLGESDVVSRPPAIGQGTDGAVGQDATGSETGARDAGSGLQLDSSDATGNGVETGGTDAGTSAIDANRDLHGHALPVDVSTAAEAQDTANSYQFFENFADGASLWAFAEGDWAISEDGGDAQANAVFGPTVPASSIAYVPSGAWQDMTVEAKVMMTSFDPSSSSSRVVLCARYQDPSHSYGVALRGDGKLSLRKNATTLGTTASVSVGENEWHSLMIRVSGPSDDVMVEGFLDGTLLTTATDATGSLPSDTGTVALEVYGGALAVFDDVSVSSP